MQLQVVSLALQTHAVGALPHVGVLVSTFLGPSSCLSLSGACSLGSVALLDWLWDVSCVSSSDRTPGWTLNNYLRSEPLYMEWQFREGLQIAASRGDLDTLNWLFHHFSGLEVPSEVVTAAAKNGHLTVLKFLLQHDQGRNCTHENKKVELDEDSWTDSVPVMPTDWKGPGNAVRWGGHATREAVRAKHFDIVRWLDEHALHENDQEEMDDVIYVAANGGSVAFAEAILPEGTTVAQYVHERALPDAIQWLLDNNLVLHNQDASASAIFTLAREGNLELMKSVAKLHSTKRLTRDWVQKWEWGMGSACERGDFAMIKWMADHRTGKEACRRDNDNKIFNTTDIIQSAARGGHIKLLEFLFQQGWKDEYASTLISAARSGHLECVKWLLENAPPFGQDNSATHVVVAAAENGHLEILQFFHDLDKSTISTERQSKRRQVERTVEWWIDAKEAMDKAAAKGQLEVVKWIHANQFNGCTKNAMDDAARNGHVDILQWLHTNTTTGCTTRAMDIAAYRGHLEVCKWLHHNRSEGCTADAIEYAIGNGHMRVAYWLRLHYPEFIPDRNRLWRYPSNTFDMLLLLKVHYPNLFSLEFGRGTKSDLLYEKRRGGDYLIAQWLDLTHPGHPTERHQIVMWPLLSF